MARRCAYHSFIPHPDGHTRHVWRLGHRMDGRWVYCHHYRPPGSLDKGGSEMMTPLPLDSLKHSTPWRQGMPTPFIFLRSPPSLTAPPKHLPRLLPPSHLRLLLLPLYPPLHLPSAPLHPG